MPAALLALAIGAFGIGTTEFVIMGLRPEAATDFGVSIPSAGLLISGYALGVVVGAPLLTAIGSKVSRKTVLVALMGVFIAGNLAGRDRSVVRRSDDRADRGCAGSRRVLRGRLGGRRVAGAEGEAGECDRADVHRSDRGERVRRSRRYGARPAVRLAIDLLGCSVARRPTGR